MNNVSFQGIHTYPLGRNPVEALNKAIKKAQEENLSQVISTPEGKLEVRSDKDLKTIQEDEVLLYQYPVCEELPLGTLQHLAHLKANRLNLSSQEKYGGPV